MLAKGLLPPGLSHGPIFLREAVQGRTLGQEEVPIRHLVPPSLHCSEGSRVEGKGSSATGFPCVCERNIKQAQPISSHRQQTARRPRSGVLICILTGLACAQLGTVSCSVVSILLTRCPPSWQPRRMDLPRGFRSPQLASLASRVPGPAAAGDIPALTRAIQGLFLPPGDPS